MAYCENCGAPLPENIRFCGRCGAPVNVGAEVKRYCKNCHAELEPGAVFCSECGYRAEPEPGPNPGPTPNPGPEPEPVPDPSRAAIRGTETDRGSGRAFLIFKNNKRLGILQQVFTDL